MAHSSRKIVIYAALLGNLAIAITKFFAAWITSSSAMFSEGVHSLVDTGNQVLLLYGLKQGAKPPDARFPFGHGKEVYFWSFVVAILVFALGAGISIYEGMHRLHDPTPITRPEVNFVVLGLAIIFEGAAWTLAVREFSRAKGDMGWLEAVRRFKDPSLFVVVFEDSAALLGLLVAMIAVALSVATGATVWDGIASIVIGLILAITAVWLARETKGLLIGESANAWVVDGIHKLAAVYPQILRVNEVLTMHIGPEFILVNLSVEFDDDIDTGGIEQTVAGLDADIKRAFPGVKRIFVEAESPPEAV
jgi:cation diffusion facilitator family transporter